jgi:hypothetical protein
VVMKALVLRNWPIYKPEISWVGNAFATSIPSAAASPFLRVYILSLLQGHYPHDVPVAKALGLLTTLLDVDSETVELELRWLMQHDWVAKVDEESIKMTARGLYVRNSLIFDSEYLTHVATDVRMYPELTRKLSFPVDSMMDRISNLLTLLEFLVARECELMAKFARRGIARFFDVFGHRLIVPEMVREAVRTLDRMDVEADESREEAVKVALTRLRTLRSSREWKTLHHLTTR